MTTQPPERSASQRIGDAVNELLGASGRERAARSTAGIAAEADAAFTPSAAPSWMTSASAAGGRTGSWIDHDEECRRTGILRTYTTERVTNAEPVGDALAGVRYSHKDNIGVAGYPVTAGNPALADLRSAVTSPLLSAVESAGGRLIGANHMAEFAMSPTGHNHWLGDGVNPLNEDYLSGGSSSGSAIAVARGTCDVSFGTDTGGSVRLPAAFCGLFGYKPTNGLFSATGLVPLSEMLDTIGLIARDHAHLLATATVLFDDESVVTPAHRDRIRRQHGESGHTLAHLSIDAVAHTSDEPVARAYERALRALGRDSVPGIEIDWSELERRSVTVVSVDAARNVGRVLNWNWDLVGDQVLSRAIRGTTVPAIAYADAVNDTSSALRSFLDEAFAGSRFLLMPTAPILAPGSTAVDDHAGAAVRRDYMRASEFTRALNYLGLPAVTVPLPTEADSLRPALQIVGTPFDDRSLLDVAATVADHVRG